MHNDLNVLRTLFHDKKPDEHLFRALLEHVDVTKPTPPVVSAYIEEHIALWPTHITRCANISNTRISARVLAAQPKIFNTLYITRDRYASYNDNRSHKILQKDAMRCAAFIQHHTIESIYTHSMNIRLRPFRTLLCTHSLPSLQTLSLHNCELNDKHLHTLTSSPNLTHIRALALPSNSFTTRGISALLSNANLARLERLNISYTHTLNAESIEPLFHKSFSNVHTLDLSSTNVTLDTLRTLLTATTLPSLQSIIVRGIRGVTLESLRDIHTHRPVCVHNALFLPHVPYHQPFSTHIPTPNHSAETPHTVHIFL